MSSKKRIFIANENGDWWEYTPGEKLYVLDMSNPSPELLSFIENDYPDEDPADYMDDSLIWNFGEQIPTPIKEK